MAVVTSGNGGATWTGRCNNGPSGVLPKVGSCPDAGYPVKIAAMPNGSLLMALDYIGGVYVSLDGGRAWKPGITSSSSNLTLSQGTDAVWMLGIETFAREKDPPCPPMAGHGDRSLFPSWRAVDTAEAAELQHAPSPGPSPPPVRSVRSPLAAAPLGRLSCPWTARPPHRTTPG